MKIKTMLLGLLMPLMLYGAGAQIVIAQSPQDTVCNQVSSLDNSCTTKDDKLFGDTGLISRIINIITFIAGSVAVIIIVIAGLMYVLSGGNPENTRRAKDAIIYAVIGLVVAIAARIIVTFVIGRI